jgi:hypothetical protein
MSKILDNYIPTRSIEVVQVGNRKELKGWIGLLDIFRTPGE